MEFLTQQNKRNAGDAEARGRARRARSRPRASTWWSSAAATPARDCIGTSNRQGAASVAQLEIMPQPPERENKALTWPDWPLKLRTSSVAGGGLRARLRRRHQAGDRRGRQGHGPGVRARGMGRRRRRPHADARGRGLGVRAQGRPGAAGHGLRRPAHGRRGRAEPASSWTRAATSRPTSSTTAPRRRTSSPAATCAAASPWWSGRSARAASAPARSTSYLMGVSKLPR